MATENLQMFPDVPSGAESCPVEDYCFRVILMGGSEEKNGRVMVSPWSEFPSVLAQGLATARDLQAVCDLLNSSPELLLHCLWGL